MASCVAIPPPPPAAIVSGTKESVSAVHTLRLEELEKAKDAITSLVASAAKGASVEALKSFSSAGVSISKYLEDTSTEAVTESSYTEQSEWICPVKMPTGKVYSSRNRPRQVKPVELVVMHYTAAGFRPMAPAIRSWAASSTQTSTHIVISRNPKLEPTIQMASLATRTFHTGGGGRWRGTGGINFRSIGVDMDNVGYLKKQGGVYYDAYGGRYTGPEPFLDGAGRYWEPYTDEATAELLNIVAQLVRIFPVLRSPEDRFVGHEQLEPTRKVDPGPAFPWGPVRQTAATGRAINISEV